MWVVVPLASVAWVAVRYRRSYFLYDEWVMIHRVVEGPWWREMLIGFNGHLWVLPYWMYHLQVNLLGVESSWFIFAGLCASLVALQVGVAAVLFRLGLPSGLALFAATIVTYFGRGSETMVLEYEFAANVALALCCFGGFVALRDRLDRKAAITVAALLVAAIAADSGLALLGMIFAGTLVVRLWPRRLAVVALGPPLAALVAWTILDYSQVLVTQPCMNCEPVSFSAPLGASLSYAFNLVARAAGGLVGGFETAGVVGLAVGLTCAAVGLAKHRLSRPVLAGLAGGLLAAAAAIVSLTYSRAGYWRTVHEAIAALGGPANRYVQPPAMFLLLGLAPAIAATLRPQGPGRARIASAAAAVGLIVVFVLNLSSVGPTRRFYDEWSAAERARVRASVAVLTDGCGPGQQPDPLALPLEALSPQITVALLQDLLARGAFSSDFGISPPPDVVAAICRPT